MCSKSEPWTGAKSPMLWREERNFQQTSCKGIQPHSRGAQLRTYCNWANSRACVPTARHPAHRVSPSQAKPSQAILAFPIGVGVGCVRPWQCLEQEGEPGSLTAPQSPSPPSPRTVGLLQFAQWETFPTGKRKPMPQRSSAPRELMWERDTEVQAQAVKEAWQGFQPVFPVSTTRILRLCLFHPYVPIPSLCQGGHSREKITRGN